MNLDFVNSIIFPEWVEIYDEEKINQIKKEAQIHGRYLKKYSDHNYILNRSIELSKSTKYKDLNQVQRLIFISNVIFDSDSNFIEVMQSYGWTKEKIKELNTLLVRIKMLQRKNYDINLDLSLLEEIRIISLSYFGIKNPAILINRLNELSITKKEKINNTKIKKY